MGTAGLELKKEILMALGYNPTIQAGKLYIEPMKWFISIKNNAPALQKEYQRLELIKKSDEQAYSEDILALSTRWRRWWDSNPRSREAHAFQACAIDHYATPPLDSCEFSDRLSGIHHRVLLYRLFGFCQLD